MHTDGVEPRFSSVSSVQKVESPTFHTPSSYTAVPAWLFSDAPLMPTLYFTAAEVAELIVTLVTVDEADCVWGEPSWLLMTLANFWPFCTREIFVAADVLPLKNASQLLVIADTAALPEVGSGAADDAGAEDAGVEVCVGDEPEPVVLLLELLQAVSAATSARPDTAATQV